MFTETVPLSAPCLGLYLTPLYSVPSAVSVPLPLLGERMGRTQLPGGGGLMQKESVLRARRDGWLDFCYNQA